MDGTDKTRINVEIFGTQYKLKGSSTPSYLKQVASHVDDHMHRIENASGGRLDTPRIAVLAAVNMADEFYQVRNELAKVWDELQRVRGELTELQGTAEELEKLRQEERAWEEVRNELEFSVRGLQLQLQETAIRAKEAEESARKEELARAAEEKRRLEERYSQEIMNLHARVEEIKELHARELEEMLAEQSEHRRNLERQWKERMEAKELDWRHAMGEREEAWKQEAATVEADWSRLIAESDRTWEEKLEAARHELEAEKARLIRDGEAKALEREDAVRRGLKAEMAGREKELLEQLQEEKLLHGMVLEEKEEELARVRAETAAQLEQVRAEALAAARSEAAAELERVRHEAEDTASALEAEVSGLRSRLKDKEAECLRLETVERTLAEENELLQRELGQEKALRVGSEEEDESLRAEYETLKDEYEKLKKEYNEWLELVLEKD